jgi:hypothetical protein
MDLAVVPSTSDSASAFSRSDNLFCSVTGGLGNANYDAPFRFVRLSAGNYQHPVDLAENQAKHVVWLSGKKDAG